MIKCCVAGFHLFVPSRSSVVLNKLPVEICGVSGDMSVLWGSRVPRSLNILALEELGRDSTPPCDFNMSSKHVGRKHFPGVWGVRVRKNQLCSSHSSHDNQNDPVCLPTGKFPASRKLVTLRACLLIYFSIIFFYCKLLLKNPSTWSWFQSIAHLKFPWQMLTAKEAKALWKIPQICSVNNFSKLDYNHHPSLSTCLMFPLNLSICSAFHLVRLWEVVSLREGVGARCWVRTQQHRKTPQGTRTEAAKHVLQSLSSRWFLSPDQE